MKRHPTCWETMTAYHVAGIRNSSTQQFFAKEEVELRSSKAYLVGHCANTVTYSFPCFPTRSGSPIRAERGVIPGKAGIQAFQSFVDPGFLPGDGWAGRSILEREPYEFVANPGCATVFSPQST